MPIAHRFIVLDGVEGAGKSTQLKRLSRIIRNAGEQLTLTLEPGGTELGRIVRQILLWTQFESTPLAETFLFCAARAQHCSQVIGPALRRGHVVLCDRFSASTFAYQGFASGAGVDLVAELDERATGGIVPDITVILDLPPEIGLGRKAPRQLALPLSRGGGNGEEGLDRIERNSLEFHNRVRQGYHEYAQRHAQRTVIVDASQDVDMVTKSICSALGLCGAVGSR